MRPGKFGDSAQPKKCGPSTSNGDFGVVTQANTWFNGTAAEHNNLDVSLENNTFGTPTKQEEIAWLDNFEQLDTSGWSDSEYLSNQTNCTDPCLSNQEGQMDGCSNDNMSSFSCSAQGDWGTCAPISCAPSRMDCVATSPPPLCRDVSCSSLLSNLSFVDSCNTDCIESDMNTAKFGDDAGDFSRVCNVDDFLSSPVLDEGFMDFE